MTSPSDAMPESPFASQDAAPAALSWRRLFYWSVRRELWENRSIYIAPLVAFLLPASQDIIELLTRRPRPWLAALVGLVGCSR